MSKLIFCYGTLKNLEIARETRFFSERILKFFKLAKKKEGIVKGSLYIHKNGRIPVLIPSKIGRAKGIIYDFNYLNDLDWARFIGDLCFVERNYSLRKVRLLNNSPVLAFCASKLDYNRIKKSFIKIPEWIPKNIDFK